MKTQITVLFFRELNILHDISDIQVINAADRDRVAASRCYVKQTNCIFEAMKTITPIDCKTV